MNLLRMPTEKREQLTLAVAYLTSQFKFSDICVALALAAKADPVVGATNAVSRKLARASFAANKKERAVT